MDVRVEAGPLTAQGCVMESHVRVEKARNTVISVPTISRFSLASVISVGGKSISAINPELFRIGVRAA